MINVKTEKTARTKHTHFEIEEGDLLDMHIA